MYSFITIFQTTHKNLVNSIMQFLYDLEFSAIKKSAVLNSMNKERMTKRYKF